MQYDLEINYLNRKLPSLNLVWEERPVIHQLISKGISEVEARTLLSKLEDAFAQRVSTKTNGKISFAEIFCIVPVGNTLQMRVVVKILKLREVFSDEIDGDIGGGGLGIRKPLQASTSLRR